MVWVAALTRRPEDCRSHSESYFEASYSSSSASLSIPLESSRWVGFEASLWQEQGRRSVFASPCLACSMDLVCSMSSIWLAKVDSGPSVDSGAFQLHSDHHRKKAQTLERDRTTRESKKTCQAEDALSWSC